MTSQKSKSGKKLKTKEEKIQKSNLIRRREKQDKLHQKANTIESEIIKDIRNLKPIGILSELQEALHITPKRGVAIGTPFGTYVFHRSREPSKQMIDLWFEMYQKAEELREKAMIYSFSIYARPHTTTGNYRVVEQGKKLRKIGLLTPEEGILLNKLEKFWDEHPDLNRQKGCGIWDEHQNLKVWKSSLT